MANQEVDKNVLDEALIELQGILQNITKNGDAENQSGVLVEETNKAINKITDSINSYRSAYLNILLSCNNVLTMTDNAEVHNQVNELLKAVEQETTHFIKLSRKIMITNNLVHPVDKE